MTWVTCCGTIKTLSRAAAKSAGARLRQLGLLSTPLDWSRRAEICERCPLRVVRRKVSYCGKPLMEQIHREAVDGCGCPTHAKAKDPTEHCPLTPRHQVATRDDSGCDCKWCAAAQAGLAT